MEGLGFDLRSKAVLTTLTDAVIKSSEIEGEDLNRQQVRSSIARRLRLLLAWFAAFLRALFSAWLVPAPVPAR